MCQCVHAVSDLLEGSLHNHGAYRSPCLQMCTPGPQYVAESPPTGVVRVVACTRTVRSSQSQESRCSEHVSQCCQTTRPRLSLSKLCCPALRPTSHREVPTQLCPHPLPCDSACMHDPLRCKTACVYSKNAAGGPKPSQETPSITRRATNTNNVATAHPPSVPVLLNCLANTSGGGGDVA
jgi:hypothetical protein